MDRKTTRRSFLSIVAALMALLAAVGVGGSSSTHAQGVAIECPPPASPTAGGAPAATPVAAGEPAAFPGGRRRADRLRRGLA